MRRPPSFLLALILQALLFSTCYDQTNLLTSNDWTDVKSFDVTSEAGERLWAIKAQSPIRIRRIEYGRTPEGFEQTVPVNGHPRSLKTGERITLVYKTGSSVVTHHGEATGSASFNPGAYEVAPLKEP